MNSFDLMHLYIPLLHILLGWFVAGEVGCGGEAGVPDEGGEAEGQQAEEQALRQKEETQDSPEKGNSLSLEKKRHEEISQVKMLNPNLCHTKQVILHGLYK